MEKEQKTLTLEDLAKENKEIKRMLEDALTIFKANKESQNFKGVEVSKKDNTWEGLE